MSRTNRFFIFQKYIAIFSRNLSSSINHLFVKSDQGRSGCKYLLVSIPITTTTTTQLTITTSWKWGSFVPFNKCRGLCVAKTIAEWTIMDIDSAHIYDQKSLLSCAFASWNITWTMYMTKSCGTSDHMKKKKNHFSLHHFALLSST